jgi:hypothetical protein
MRNKEEVKVLQGRIAQAERKEVAVAKKVERDESLLKDRIEAARIKKKEALDAITAASRSTEKAERQLKESKERETELLADHQKEEYRLRAINDSRVKDLEKFRLQASRLREQKRKAFSKDYSKVDGPPLFVLLFLLLI